MSEVDLAPYRRADEEQAGFLTNFGMSLMQDSPIIRDNQKQSAYLRAMGTLSPARIPGYNPFQDEGVQAFLSGNPTAAHLFSRSGSFIESQVIANLAQERTDREADLERNGAGWSRFLAGMADPVNIAMAPIGIGGLTAATTLGRIGQAAGRSALLGGASEIPFSLSQGDLPGDLQGDAAVNIALSATFGAALGGLAGSVSRRYIERAALDHARAHDTNDGLTTPGATGDGGPRPVAPAGPSGVLDEAQPGPMASVGRGRFDGQITPERFDELQSLASRLMGREVVFQVNDADNRSWGEAWGHVVRLAFRDGAEVAVDTTYHEAVHALRNMGKITEDEWRILGRQGEIEGWTAQHGIEDRYAGRYLDMGAGKRADLIAEEGVAEQIAAFMRGDYKPEGVLATIFEKLREFIERVGNGVRGLGFQSANDVFRAIDAGVIGAREVGSAASQKRTVSTATALRGFDDNATGPVFRSADDIRQYEASEPPRLSPPPRDINDDYSMPREAMAREAAAPPKQEDLDRILPTGLGMEKLRWTQMPYYWLKNSPFAGTVGRSLARIADEIAQTPGLRMKGVNVAGYAQASDSVEALKKQYGARFHHAITAQDEAYYRYMGWDPKSATPFRVRATEIGQQVGLARGEGKLSFEEFDQAVGASVASGKVPSVTINGQSVEVPEALAAGLVWREFYDRFEEEAAGQGILLSAKHKGIAQQALSNELATREALIADLEVRLENSAKLNPDLVRGMEDQLAEMQSAARITKNRQKWLAQQTGTGEPYVPHSWREGHVRRNRDKLSSILQNEWAREAHGEGTPWAPPSVRAELAISHILGDGLGDTLERVLFAYWKLQRSPDEAARLAAEGAAGARAVEAEMGPSKVRVEIDSLIGRRSPEDSAGGYRLGEAIAKAVKLPGMDQARVANEIITTLGVPSTNDLSRPWNARQRQIDVPTSAVAEFLDLSQRASGADYAWRMGAAIEFSRRFGDPQMLNHLDGMMLPMWDEVAAGRATVADVQAAQKAMRDLRDKVAGNFATPQDASAYSVRTARFLVNSAVMAQMGGALISNVADVGRLVMAHGLRETLRAGIDALNNRETWRLAGNEALEAGAALEMTTLGRTREMQDLRDIGADVTVVEKWAQSGAQAMQFLNLTAPWTNMMQRFSGALHQSAMVRMSAALVDGTLSADDAVRLRSYGISPDLAKRITDNWRANGGDIQGDLHLANTGAWTDIQAQRQFRAALATAVDISVMRPGAADRPNFMSAPLGQALLLYKGFGLATTQRMLMAGMQQRDARVLSGVMASVTIAWVMQQATADTKARGTFVNWDAVYDEDTKRATEGGLFEFGGLLNAIDRSGALGIFSDLNNAMEMATSNTVGIRPLLGVSPPSYAKDPTWAQRIGAAAGPAVSPWLNLTWAMTAEDAKGDQVAGAVRRTLPFNNLLWTEWAFRALGAEAGGAIGDPDRQPPL